ncbi:MAG: endonuclease III domain-containing protein [Candidatus Omnitrophica bacterium]|nr:endonuclease III domain-containing protein [Candidatus Omnitrophota bacterium]
MSARNRYTCGWIRNIYQQLFSYFGPQHWWPAESPFEVIIGAILTQNTAWTNVEQAISRLKQKQLLTPQKLYRIKTKTLAGLIRSCGYYNIKAARLKSFLQALFCDFGGCLKSLFSLSTPKLREKLLQINGIGPETADSILLYAAERPVFVVDAYTKRLLLRHRLIKNKYSYQQIQDLFTKNLPRNLKMFNEYHALIVRLGKEYCRSQARCQLCPLNRKG